MGIRSRIFGTLTGTGDEHIREVVEQLLAARAYVGASDVRALERRLEALAGAPADTGRLDALEERIAALEKKISMAMGAVQAGTAQIMSVRRTAEEAAAGVGKAQQAASSALATSESAADGINELEIRLEALESAASAPAESKKAPTKKKSATKKKAAPKK